MNFMNKISIVFWFVSIGKTLRSGKIDSEI